MAKKNRNSENVPAKSEKVTGGVSKEIQVRHEAEFFSGPFPPPAIVKEYEDIQPGFADRIFTYAENEQTHRHASQSEIIGIDKREVYVSFFAHAITNICITVMFISLLAVGSYALHLGQTGTALAIFAVPIGRMVISMTHMVRKENGKK